MNYIFKGTGLDLTEELEESVKQKMEGSEKLLKNFPGIVEARVELGRTTSHHRSGDIYRAEINLRVDGEVLRAEAEAFDIHAAIDGVKDKIHREIEKRHKRRISIVRRGARAIKNILRSPF